MPNMADILVLEAMVGITVVGTITEEGTAAMGVAEDTMGDVAEGAALTLVKLLKPKLRLNLTTELSQCCCCVAGAFPQSIYL